MAENQVLENNGSTVVVKFCSRCNIEKCVSEFYYQHTKNRFTPQCKVCHKKFYGKWYHENKERSKKYHKEYRIINKDKVRECEYYSGLKWRYGLSKEAHKNLCLQQKNKCATCGLSTGLAVDHCHKTAIVRGLLCKKCNSVLGYVQDNPVILRAMISYLEKNKSTGMSVPVARI